MPNGTDTFVSDEDTDTSMSDVDSKTVYNNEIVYGTFSYQFNRTLHLKMYIRLYLYYIILPYHMGPLLFLYTLDD